MGIGGGGQRKMCDFLYFLKINLDFLFTEYYICKNKMWMEKQDIPRKSNAGRKKKPESEKVAALPLFAKKKNHEAILGRVAPIVKRMDSKN